MGHFGPGDNLMRIRLIQETDLDACGRIYADAFSKPPYSEPADAEWAAGMLAGSLEKDPESCWGIEDDGRLVGFAFCTVFGELRATIQEFAVSPSVQGRGFGTALMKHAMGEFTRRGLQSVDLVANRHAPAYRFYERFGFYEPRYYRLMTRKLRDNE